MTENKQIRRIKFVMCLVSILAVYGSICYILQWQPRMHALSAINQQLQKDQASQCLKPLMEDMNCFPVRADKAGKETFSFEDGYGQGRSYGGSRTHEGIDIMSVSGKRGNLEIQSVSDGVVEKIGWLELGGYRIGIRSPSGMYFYYAHLDSYAENLKQGDKVQAGQILGTMGDSGYGKEGTRGKFAVHLHFGIYYTEDGQEKSLNPFYLLQYHECGIIKE